MFRKFVKLFKQIPDYGLALAVGCFGGNQRVLMGSPREKSKQFLYVFSKSEKPQKEGKVCLSSGRLATISIYEGMVTIQCLDKEKFKIRVLGVGISRWVIFCPRF